MSISDVGVGFITIPCVMLTFSYLYMNKYCTLIQFTTFSAYFPVSFSYGATTIISIDRCLMVTKSNFHTKYVTTRVITFLLIGTFVNCLAFSFGNMITFSLDTKSTAVWILHIFQYVISISVILCTCCVNLHLYCFVKRISQQMEESRHQGIRERYSSRLTTTIAYIFTFMVVCNGPTIITNALVDMNINMSPMLRGNLYKWGLLLIYSNSYINAIIVLTRTSNLQATKTKKKTEKNKIYI